jgi:hypothetical protein
VGTTDGSFDPVVGTQRPTIKEGEARENEVSHSFSLLRRTNNKGGLVRYVSRYFVLVMITYDMI